MYLPTGLTARLELGSQVCKAITLVKDMLQPDFTTQSKQVTDLDRRNTISVRHTVPEVLLQHLSPIVRLTPLYSRYDIAVSAI